MWQQIRNEVIIKHLTTCTHTNISNFNDHCSGKSVVHLLWT